MMGKYDQPGVVQERVRFFDGQFLVDQDFIDEQRYHLDHQRRLPLALRVQGILDGLAVTVSREEAADTDQTASYLISVAPGTAIDELGHQLVLEHPAQVRVPDDETLAKYTAVRVMLLHRQAETRPTPAEITAGLKENTRFDETPVVAAMGETGDLSEYLAADPPGALAELTAVAGGVVVLRTLTRGEGTLELDAENPSGYAGLRVLGAVGVGTHDPGTHKLAVAGGDTDLGGSLTVADRVGIGIRRRPEWTLEVAGDTSLGGKLTVTGQADIANGLHVRTAPEGGSALRVSASANHLQLRREGTESTGGSQVFLELVQFDGGGTNLPQVHPSILFGHEYQFFNRIEAQYDGFHLRVGGSEVAEYADLHVNGLETKGNVELGGYVRIGASTEAKQKLHVIGGQTFIEGDLFVKGQLAFWWEPDKRWMAFKNASGSASHRTWAETSADARQPSDARLKAVDGPLRDALTTLSRLNGVRYRWSAAGTDFLTRGITDSVSAGPDATEAQIQELCRAERRKAAEALAGPRIGLLAQEVEAVIPEVVSEDGEGYKYVNYGHIVALLIEAIKEQQVAIDRLDARLNRLEPAHA